MTRLRCWRQSMALLLMVMGGCMLVRGLIYCVTHHLSWTSVIPALVVPGLVIALGWARWRFLQGGD